LTILKLTKLKTFALLHIQGMQPKQIK